MTDMTKEGAQIFASSEIMGAALTANMSKSDSLTFSADPKSFIHSSLDVDMGVISVLVVENDSGTINLTLPYYSSLETMSIGAVNELDMDGISGGEILISIFAIGGAIAAAATAGALGVTGLLTTGVGIAVVAGGAIAGGVVGAGAIAGIGVGAAAGHKAGSGENLDGSSK